MKKIAIFFYVTGSILVTLPLIIFQRLQIKSIIINNIINMLNFKLNILTILILFLSITIIILFDIFLLKNKSQLKKNIIMIEQIFGEKINIKLNTILSLLSGYFEELLFRGYMYFFLIRILYKNGFINNLYIELIIISFISSIFALFHMVQGKEAFFISFLISIIFFISIKLSSSIWYAILAHSTINFIEFTFIIPYQKKKLL